MTTTYRTISLHTDGERTADFATWDEAKAHADTLSPERDGSTVPNVPEQVVQAFIEDDTYEAGCFWLSNRYAIIIKITQEG